MRSTGFPEKKYFQFSTLVWAFYSSPFFFCTVSLLLCCPLLMPVLFSAPFSFCSLWVWLKVARHWLTFRIERRKQKGEKDGVNSKNSRGGRGAVRRADCPQYCAVITFPLDMIGEVWKDTWDYRLSKNAKGINTEPCSTSDPRLTSTRRAWRIQSLLSPCFSSPSHPQSQCHLRVRRMN